MANGKDDLRLDLGWPDHPKTRRLIRLCGFEGAFCLLRLWSYAGRYHTDGVLLGLSPEDIEEAVQWSGPALTLHQALVACKWLEPDGVTLHDWPDEQPWIFGKAERSMMARDLATRRWERVRAEREANAERNATRIAKRNAKGNAPSPSPSPSPTPSPAPSAASDRGPRCGGEAEQNAALASPPQGGSRGGTAEPDPELHRARVVATLLGQVPRAAQA